MKPDLQAVQSLFAQGVISDQISTDLLEQIQPAGSLSSSASALEIYQDGYQARLLDSLKQTYPATLDLVGEESFELLAHRFISENPSTSFNLNTYGENFPLFLDHAPLLQDIPPLNSLARLELLHSHAFHDPRPFREPLHYFIALPHAVKDFLLERVLGNWRRPQLLSLFKSEAGEVRVIEWEEEEFYQTLAKVSDR